MNNTVKLKQIVLIVGIILIELFSVKAADKTGYKTPSQYIQHEVSKNAFTIVANGEASSIYVDSSDWKGVIRAAKDLSDDVRMV